jgi:O-antigen/teichoic acid export membrane protein
MVWTAVGAAGGKVLTAACSIALARLLAPEGYGQFGIVQSTVLMFATYGAFRMGNTAIKYVAQYRESDPARAARILRLALSLSAGLLGLIAVVVAALSAPLAQHTLKARELRTGLLIGAVYLFVLTYGSIAQQALAGFESFKAISKNALLGGALKLLFCVPLGYLWGVEGALVGLVLAAASVLFQAWVFLKREEEKFRFPKAVPLRAAFAEWPVLWQFALPSFLMLALMTGTSWLVRVMLTRQAGFAELGLFEAAGQWVTVIYFVPTILARVVMPMLSASDGVQDHAEYRQTLSLQIRTILLITGPATVLMLGLGTWVALVYGSRYAGTERLMPLLFASGFLRTLNEACRIVYESKGRQWAGFGVYLVWAAVLLGSAWVLLPPRGAMGLAVAALIAELTLLAVSAAQVHFWLVRGGLAPSARLFVRMLGLVFLAYLAHVRLQPVWSSVASLFLVAVAVHPLLRTLHRSKVHLEAIGEMRSLVSGTRLGLP